MSTARVQYRTQHATPNFLVNVGWWCGVLSLLVFVAAVDRGSGEGWLSTTALIWALGAIAVLRARRMGLWVTPRGLKSAGLLWSRTLPPGGTFEVRVDRVSKEQVFYVCGKRQIPISHFVHIGAPRLPSVGLYPTPNAIERRTVDGWRAGPWNALSAHAHWGKPDFMHALGFGEVIPAPPASPAPQLAQRELVAAIATSSGSIAALVAYAVTDAYALLGVSLLLMVCAGILVRRARPKDGGSAR